jgi:hypothetical protein
MSVTIILNAASAILLKLKNLGRVTLYQAPNCALPYVLLINASQLKVSAGAYLCTIRTLVS